MDIDYRPRERRDPDQLCKYESSLNSPVETQRKPDRKKKKQWNIEFAQINTEMSSISITYIFPDIVKIIKSYI